VKLYDKIINKEANIAVVGLGYVGLPLAVAFADKVNTIGFDINEEKIADYKSGIDPTEEVGEEKSKRSDLQFTSEEKDTSEAGFIIVAVPTPVNGDETPDLNPVVVACKIVGRYLS
jgi:UDP-N-acetyl-D-galactosamine dehydrogenase